MKKLLPGLLIIISSLTLISCGKSGRDMYANFDRVDDLFGRIKDDSTYKAFYDLVVINSGIMISNSKKSGKADTAILNNRDLTLEEKYKKLNYAEYSAVESNTVKQASLVTLLISKYPEFKTLSDTESKKLVMLSKKYYRKQTK